MQKRIDAFFPPKVSSLAIKIFNFFTEMERYQILAGGMSHIMMGLDIIKIGELGSKYYNIDITRYLHLIRSYENEMIKQQNKENK